MPHGTGKYRSPLSNTVLRPPGIGRLVVRICDDQRCVALIITEKVYMNNDFASSM